MEKEQEITIQEGQNTLLEEGAIEESATKAYSTLEGSIYYKKRFVYNLEGRLIEQTKTKFTSEGRILDSLKKVHDQEGMVTEEIRTYFDSEGNVTDYCKKGLVYGKKGNVIERTHIDCDSEDNIIRSSRKIYDKKRK